MDNWEWTKIGTAVVLALGSVAGATLAADLLMAPDYPRRQGYAIDGVPPVDLVEAQRDWPTRSNAAEREQLLGYISNIEHASIPAPPEGAVAAPSEAPVSLEVLLASAEPERGRRVAQSCLACHNVAQGGPNQIGPNLWGVVGRPVASHAGFAYSSAMQQHAGNWTYEELDQFLTRPSQAVPGTKMAFAGIRNPRERANLLAYLGTLGGPTKSSP